MSGDGLHRYPSATPIPSKAAPSCIFTRVKWHGGRTGYVIAHSNRIHHDVESDLRDSRFRTSWPCVALATPSTAHAHEDTSRSEPLACNAAPVWGGMCRQHLVPLKEDRCTTGDLLTQAGFLSRNHSNICLALLRERHIYMYIYIFIEKGLLHEWSPGTQKFEPSSRPHLISYRPWLGHSKKEKGPLHPAPAVTSSGFTFVGNFCSQNSMSAAP